MKSSLQQQLSTLSGRQPKHKFASLSKSPSLIYTQEVAKGLGMEEVYDVGNNGILSLCKLDGCFEPFRETLFGAKYKEIDRDFESKEFNEELDSLLSRFLRLLSPYFMLRPAHKALEWLIRRFRVWRFNVEEVMECILPYHETNLFVRMVQMCYIYETKWEFLETIRKSSSPLSRQNLVESCYKDDSLLSFVVEAARNAVKECPNNHSTYVSFYTVLILEMFSRYNVRDNKLRIVLPLVFEALKSKSLDFRVRFPLFFSFLLNINIFL